MFDNFYNFLSLSHLSITLCIKISSNLLEDTTEYSLRLQYVLGPYFLLPNDGIPRQVELDLPER